jgi:hypothetical protein
MPRVAPPPRSASFARLSDDRRPLLRAHRFTFHQFDIRTDSKRLNEIIKASDTVRRRDPPPLPLPPPPRVPRPVLPRGL